VVDAGGAVPVPPAGAGDIWPRMGIHDFPLAFSVVVSMTCVAVVVPPETVPVTTTVSPLFTLAMPDSPPFTLVEEFTVKVPLLPSALFTVSDQVDPDVLDTAETVPVRSSMVS
jgi:hypothetical protein